MSAPEALLINGVVFALGIVNGVILMESATGGQPMSNNARAVWITAIICAFVLGILWLWKL